MLFVLIILGHDRRRLVHMAVTGHPTAAWTAQQLRNAFPETEAPGYLLHDGDAVFADVAATIAAMNIQAVRTAPRSPWHNAFVERVIRSIRRECLDHVIVVKAAGCSVCSPSLQLLPHAVMNASLARQGCADPTAARATVGRRHRSDAAGWRAPSSLRSRGSLAAGRCPRLATSKTAPPPCISTPTAHFLRRLSGIALSTAHRD